MSANVIEFPRAAVVVPLFEESRRFARESDANHCLRWYDMGARCGFVPSLNQYARLDGADYVAAYEAGWMARTFGVSLRECFT